MTTSEFKRNSHQFKYVDTTLRILLLWWFALYKFRPFLREAPACYIPLRFFLPPIWTYFSSARRSEELFPLLPKNTLEGVLHKLWCPCFASLNGKYLCEMSQRRKINISRNIAKPWNLPEERSRNVLMILDSSNAVRKHSFIPIIHINDAPSEPIDDLRHQINI